MTRDIRTALRDLAEGNADRVQEWLDQVAAIDPAEAVRLWLALLRFVTPTLAAATVADVSPPKSARLQLARMTDEQLFETVVMSPESQALIASGTVCNLDELLGFMAQGKPPALIEYTHDCNASPDVPNDPLLR